MIVSHCSRFADTSTASTPFSNYHQCQIAPPSCILRRAVAEFKIAIHRRWIYEVVAVQVAVIAEPSVPAAIMATCHVARFIVLATNSEHEERMGRSYMLPPIRADSLLLISVFWSHKVVSREIAPVKHRRPLAEHQSVAFAGENHNPLAHIVMHKGSDVVCLHAVVLIRMAEYDVGIFAPTVRRTVVADHQVESHAHLVVAYSRIHLLVIGLVLPKKHTVRLWPALFDHVVNGGVDCIALSSRIDGDELDWREMQR